MLTRFAALTPAEYVFVKSGHTRSASTTAQCQGERRHFGPDRRVASRHRAEGRVVA
jgi:hypothetical protein